MDSNSTPFSCRASDSASNDPKLYEPIAIIGMGMRLPGGIRNAADYWDLLVNGKSGRCRVPKSRYNVDTWHGPGRVSHVPTEYGYFLEELNLAHVDPSFWSFTKQEAELMDPRQRLFLEVAYEALESSGVTNFRGSDVGVYVGTMGDDWSQLESRDEQNLNPVRPDVYGDYILPNRASYEFDLTGPSIMVRTACSASLVALHMACRDLQNGDCTSALVGGVNLILAPRDTAAMHQQGVLSPTSSCKTFDANADGFARGEGVSAIYIKKLSDAVRDGDPIRAVIRSTCTAGNGRTPGLTTPNPRIHEKLMRKGHHLAGITDFSKTAMVECHGTGTTVGDPLEVSAVANIWGDCGIYIGSVKPNIGHGEGASGLSCVIKMVLALENSTIPPNINFETPNPKIPWESAKLEVPTKPLSWPADRLERVSVNSFGIGGSNAHVLLESAACFGVPSSNTPEALNLGSPNQRLLTFSARHPDSVKRLADATQHYLNQHPSKLGDVAYSLSSRREVHSHRAFCLADGGGKLQMSQVTKSSKKRTTLIWVFTGQGAQWAQMGKELLEQEPLFQQRINDLDMVLARLPSPPPWTLKGLLLAPKEESRLPEAEFSQPCLAAIQVALVDLLRSWGVAPTAVVGHSSGETAAAYASGAITVEDAIRIAYHRGQITRLIKAAHKGSMAAVGLGRDQVTRFLRPGVIIGCENSPSNVTLSGEADVLETVMQDIRDEHPDVLVRSLRVECGYHSHHMKTASPDFASRLEGIFHAREPTVPFYSSVTGKLNNDISPSYWVQNIISPVLFNPAVQKVLDDYKSPIFVEIGPHSALAGPTRQIMLAMNRNAQYIPTLVRNQDAVSCVLKTAGELWLAGVDVSLASVVPPGKFLTDLPTYPWYYDGEYWVESRLSRSWRLRRFDHHELLGTRAEEISDACPAWRCKLRVEDAPWLRDHIVLGEMVFPAAGFISMIGEAMRQLKGSVDYTVKQLHLKSALVLNDRPVELVTVLNPSQLMSSSGSEWFHFTISSLDEGSDTWIKHVTGQCWAGSGYKRLAQDITPLPRKVSATSFYKTWKRFGLNYGTKFRNLTDISSHVSEPKAVATLNSPSSSYENASYAVHPTTLDSSLHFAMISSCLGLERNLKQIAVPTYIDEIYISKAHGEIRLEGTTNLNHAIASSQTLGVSDGEVVIDIRGLEVNAASTQSVSDEDDPHAGAILDWKPDIDFLDPLQILRRRDFGACSGNLDKMVLACIVESRAQLQFLPATQPHLVKFKSWLDASYRQALTGEYPDLLNAFDIAAMGPNPRQILISEMFEACKGTAAEHLALAVHRVFLNGAACFSGKHDAMKLLAHEDVLKEGQEFLSDVDLVDFLRLLGHKKPALSILHIGDTPGEDSTIARMLSTLSSSRYDGRMLGSYVCTGISAEPHDSLAELFKDFPGVKYSELNVEDDPVPQGFSRESFDLILLPGSMWSPPSLAATKNMRKLLKSTGHLVLQHPNPVSTVFRYIFGLVPESTSQSPQSLTEQDLRSRLNQTGFDGDAAVIFSGDHSRLTIATPFVDHWKTTQVSVLCQNPRQHLVEDASRALRCQGLDLDFFTPGEELPWGQPVVCLLDLEIPFLHNLTRPQWEELKRTLFSAQGEKVLWITVVSQIDCKDPNYSLVLGVARSLRRELSMDIVTLELDTFDANGWNAMSTVLDTFGERFTGGEVEPDSEYVFTRGLIHVCRFRSVRVSEDMRERCEGTPTRLTTAKPGNLQNLRWKQTEAIPLEGDSVEVEMRVVGLNSKDLTAANGSMPKRHDGNGDFGLEGSGIVRTIGPEAQRFRIGDRVAFSHDGCLSSSVTLSEKLCVAVPESLTFVEAASTPYSYSTALYGLMELGKLRKGQSLLIYSACDAVGLAAVQLAQTIGAKIFCTVNHTEKAEYLISSYGLSKCHVLNFKHASISSEILRLTNGCGVDVVFGQLSGELLHDIWKCVAPFGSMIQIGRPGSLEKSQLQISQLGHNRTFVNLDLDELSTHRPLECARLLEQAFMFCRLGLNQPAQPIRTFEASSIIGAFQHMQSEVQIGRVVVQMPHGDNKLPAVPLQAKMNLRSDRTYVFIGGLGGLGQATARFLAERGARNLLFFSRSAEETAKAHPEYFEELQALGCTVRAISGSVSNMADVVRMVDSATTPVAGVLQAAMVLQDVNIADMTFEQWQTTVKPKVQGTWNLHHALQAQSEPLDFFFLFSSLSGLGGQIGQANYAAGNAFLDAFVQYRHSQGLACSVLDIGIMEDIGVLAREQNRLEALRATTQHCLHEQELLDALELMIRRSHASPTDEHIQDRWIEGYVNPSQVAIGMRSSSSASAGKRTGWQKDPRSGFLADTPSSHQNTNERKADKTLKEFLQNCSADLEQLASDEAKTFLAEQIGGALQGFTMQQDEEVDLSLPLQTDSLVTVELRNWLRQKMGVMFTVLEMRRAESIFALGEAAAMRLAGGLASAN